MKSIPKPWLPADATDPARIAALLDGALEQWSKHWLKSEEASSAPAFQDDWPGANATIKWRSIPGVASVALTQNAQAAIASAMLGCTIPPGSVQTNDRAILEKLSKATIDDLLTRLASLAGVTGSQPVDEPLQADGGQTWNIFFRSGKRAFKLAMSREAQVSLVKRRLAPASKPKLSAIEHGLGEQRVELTVDLGRCAISLSELQELGNGDVIVFDRSSEDQASLLVDGFGSPLRGMLESIDGRTCFTLASFKDHSHA